MTEYEAVTPLCHIQRIVDLKWDALGAALALVVEIGPEDGSRSMRAVISLDPVEAAALSDVLPQALAGRPGAAAPRQ